MTATARPTPPEPATRPPDVSGQVGRLRATFGTGRTRDPEWRIGQLRSLEAMFVEREAEITAAVEADLGRSAFETVLTNSIPVAVEAAYARRHLRRWIRPRRTPTPLAMQPGIGHYRHEPLGVVGIIGPWNYPINLTLSPLVGALAAGNCGLIKPSEHAPATADLLARLPAKATPSEPKGIHAWPPKHRLLALATALGVALGLAGWFRWQTYALRADPAARNLALVDVGRSTQAISQVSTAMERVYSFDYTRLDENERVAREMITPEFGDDFATLFEQVRKLAPQQQAVVSATVAMAAVKELEGDRAVLVLFLDQQATRGADAKQLLASGRVTVSAQLVDGRWKIAGVDSR